MASRAAGKQPPPPAQVRIERVGAEGDGVGRLADGPVYVPFSLPGEALTVTPVRVRGDGWYARVKTIDQRSEARVEPPCGYFGRCGGCGLQHWRDDEYADWKRGLLTGALRKAGFATPPTVTLVRGLPGERRRLDFAVRRERGQIVLGLHAAGSAEIVDLTHCLVLHPSLMALMAPLRTVLRGLSAVRRQASVVINLLQSGPDLLLRGDAAPSLADRTRLIEFARAHGVPRVSRAVGAGPAEPVCVFRPGIAMMAGVEVRPPPGAFLQATAEGERAIVDAVLAALPDRIAGRGGVAETYAGCGTLTFGLARRARVTAWEGDAESVAALKDAVNRAGLSGRVQPVRRDLTRQPLSAKELAGFGVVVLDPPHAGAAAQMAEIAAAGVPTVVYVGCNPATLARDAGVLRAAGYDLLAATAIDQFLWSARLESVCVLRRG